MKSLTLFDKQSEISTNIHHDGDMVSLTDLWKEAGSNKDKTPNDWRNIESNQQLIDTVASMLNTVPNGIIKSKRGKGGGTYAHKQIALAYAKYLDPKLHVLVNEVFFQRIEEEKNPDLAIERGIKTYKKQGRTDEWIAKRLNGKGKRNEFTSCLAAHGVEKDGFRNCTNAIYTPLYGGSTAVVREKKNLEKGVSIRDNLSSIELDAINFAESLSKHAIERDNIRGNAKCELACSKAAQIVASAVNKSKTINY